MQTYYNQCGQPAPVVRENYGCNGANTCPMSAKTIPVQDVNQVQTPCHKCTSIYLALKDRSDYDKAYLRSYNRLPAHYQTNLDSLVFAP